MVPTQPSPPAAPASKRPGAKRTRPASDAKERREALVSHLRTQGSTSVADLPRLFGVSIETIRRDLRLLESTGRIRRSYGRVAAADSGSFESSREFRVSHLVDEKERIARAAVEHLDTAETIFLDEGFHPLLVGRALPTDRDLTIVTACLPTAIELAERPRTQVVVIGGRVRPITLASVERWATRMLREMEPDLAIVGANGVFIVDVKTRSGKIEPTAGSDWIRHKVGSKGTPYRVPMKNPLQQMKRNIRELQSYLASCGVRPWIDGSVYFTRAEFEEQIEGCYTSEDAVLDHIKNFPDEHPLSDEEQKTVAAALAERL